MSYGVMKNRYKANCAECGEQIALQAWMTYDGAARHVACQPCAHKVFDIEGHCIDCGKLASNQGETK